MSRKKVLFTILSAILMVFLAACGNGPAPAAVGDAGPAAPAAAAATEDGETTAEAPPQEGLLEVTFVANIDQTMIDNTLNQLEGETFYDNRWTRRIAEDLGIQVTYLWTANDPEAYDLRISLALAAGDLPDIIHLGHIQLAQAVAAGLATPIQPLVDNYASDLLRELIYDGGPDAIEAATFDGTWFGLGIGDAPIESSSLLYIREDWRQALGLEVPRTLEDMFTMIEAFMDFRGDDAVGMTIYQGLLGHNQLTLDALLNIYGAYHNFWIPDGSGGLAFSNIQPEYRRAIEMAAEMFRRGYFDREFTVQDQGMAVESIVSSRNGIYFGAHWTPLWPQPDSLANDPEADWFAHPLPTLDGSMPIVGTRSAISEWYVVNSRFEHPEVMILLMNHYAKLTFCPINQEYLTYSNPDGIDGVWKLNPVSEVRESNKNPANSRLIRPHLDSGDPGDLFGEALAMWEFSLLGFDPANRLEMQGWNRIMASGVNFPFPYGGASSIMYDAWAEGRYVRNQFVGAPTPTMETHLSILENAWLEEMTRIIIGDVSIDHFETAVQSWLASGGEAIVSEVNEWYAGR